MTNEEQVVEELDDSWMLNLQEFVDALEPNIRDSTTSQEILDMLSTLEATDVNFHRYEFIQQIRNKLNEELTPMVIKTVEDLDNISDDNIAVSNVGRIVLDSKEFMMLSNDLCEKVKLAAQEITEHLKSEHFDFSELPRYNKNGAQYFNNESICSTADGIDYMFMSPDRYKSLAKEIEPTKSLTTRLNALGVLQQVPQTDLVASDAWQDTCHSLRIALDDDVDEVNLRAMKFLSRLFLSGSSHVVREYILILVGNLISYFNDDTSHMVAIDYGLDIGDKRNVMLLRKFRLLSQILQELPSYWLRYPEKYVNDIAESLLKLIKIVPRPIALTVGKNLMSPLHFLSLLDPLAKWFKLWTHGCYGRFQLFKSISFHRQFLDKQIGSCMDFSHVVCSSSDKQNKENEEYVYFLSEDINYFYFLHSLSVTSRIMLYENGRNLLTTKINNTNINVKTLLLIFVKILEVYPFESTEWSKSIHHPVVIIVNAFREFSLNRGSMECIDNDICLALLSPIENYTIELKVSFALINVVSEILTQFISTQIIQSDQIFESITTAVSNSLKQFFVKRNLETSCVISLMSLLCEIYSMPCGSLMLQIHDIFNLLHVLGESQPLEQNSLLDRSTINSDIHQSNSNNLVHKDILEFQTHIFQYILAFAMTARGLYYVLQSKLLNESVSILFSNYFDMQYNCNNFKEMSHSVILYHLAATQTGIIALEKSGYVADLLQAVWQYLEGYENDYKKTVLTNNLDDISDRNFQELHQLFIKLFSSFSAVYHLCSNTVVYSTEKDGPVELRCLNEFFNFAILLDSVSKIQRLYHFETTHLFGLYVLNTLVNCLDSRLYFETTYNFRQVLLNMQHDCQRIPDNKEYILDECSVKRNQILVKAYLIGGPNEIIVPPGVLTQDAASPYPWPLFSILPVPDAYIVRSTKAEVDNEIAFENDATVILDAISSQLCDIEKDENNSRKCMELSEKLKDVFFSSILRKNSKEMSNMIMLMIETSINLLLHDDRSTLTVINEKEAKRSPVKLSSKKIKLNNLNELGIEVIVRYGLQLRLLRSQQDATESLRSILLQIREHLNLSHQHTGFDWFVAVIFLLFSSQDKDPLPFLKNYSKTVHSVYLWPNRLNTKHSAYHSYEHVHPLLTKSCHSIDFLLQKELPHVYAAFCLSNFPSTLISLHWLRQCFLNYLDFSDILWYISCCILLGLDYQVYFTVSIYKHLESGILHHSQNNDLVSYLLDSSMQQFHVQEHVAFMKSLEEKYHSMLDENLKDW